MFAVRVLVSGTLPPFDSDERCIILFRTARFNNLMEIGKYSIYRFSSGREHL
jgi:hypothetical protein